MKAGAVGPARRGDALYFALLPDRRTANHIVGLGLELQRRGQVSAWPTPADLLHVSIWGFARSVVLSEATVRGAKAVGARVSWPDFDLLFAQAMTFGGNALVLRCSEGPRWALRGLQEQIAGISEELGLGPSPRRPFDPHLTFAWAREPMPAAELDEVVRWPARELVLVHSEQGKARHHHVARWPLRRDRIEW